MSLGLQWHRSRLVQVVSFCSIVLLLILVRTNFDANDRVERTNPAEHDQYLSAAFAQSERPITAGSIEALASLGEAPRDSRLHVVIAHFEEEPFWIGRWLASLREIASISALQPHFTVYTKSNKISLQRIKDASTADLVVLLPNLGREGGTYLHHILQNWDNLPNHTMFTQAQLKKAQQLGSGPKSGSLDGWFVDRLASQFKPEVQDGQSTGFMSLDRKHDIGLCGHFTDMGSDEFYPLWPQLFAMMSGRPCAAGEPSVVSFNGHFIVSRKRILERPKELYEYIQSLVNAGPLHWIHREKPMRFFSRRFGQSTPSNPVFGHTLERLWHVLFKCADEDRVQGCDIMAGQREGAGGCYCMDSEAGSSVGSG